jgi:hypothetical protein
MSITNFVGKYCFQKNYYYCEVLCSSSFLKELFELIKLILWCSNNQTYRLDSWEILRFLGVAFQSFIVLVSHLVRWRVKAQQILSTRSWGFKPSLLSGFITIVGGVHISLAWKENVCGLHGGRRVLQRKRNVSWFGAPTLHVYCCPGIENNVCNQLWKELNSLKNKNAARHCWITNRQTENSLVQHMSLFTFWT